MLTSIPAVSNVTLLPERLNLAIAKRCFVSCQGCYTNFGRHEPDLARLLESVSRFVDLGVRDITISGGDPLTIGGILEFIDDLRRVGTHSIKLDTVGTHLIDSSQREETTPGFQDRLSLHSLLKRLDFVGIPLDGWSNATASSFRAGRPQLFDETVELLDAIDCVARAPMVIVNTVAHAMNLSGVSLIGHQVLRHRAVCHWNVFQFSATDQVSAEINAAYRVTGPMFHAAEKAWRNSPESNSAAAQSIEIEFRSVRARLGQYLLINSDGMAWVPDEHGQTILLGAVFKHEQQILADWSRTAFRLRTLGDASICGDR